MNPSVRDPIDPSVVDPDTADKLADFGRRAAREQRRRYGRAPKPAKAFVAELLAKKGYAARGAAEEIRTAWREAAGPTLERFSRAGVIRRGVLEVTVANSTARQEIEFHRPRLLAEMQKALPDAKITSLRLRVGRL